MRAAELAAICDELLGTAGYAHRSITIEDEHTGLRLAPDFVAMGWVARRDLIFLVVITSMDKNDLRLSLAFFCALAPWRLGVKFSGLPLRVDTPMHRLCDHGLRAGDASHGSRDASPSHALRQGAPRMPASRSALARLMRP